MGKEDKNEYPQRYGSDLMAELIANLKVPFIALNPGASFRGLHDSLVNHPSRQMPELITCTHEEISVDVAHGYAKATGKVMAAAIHNVVGLQHASMAIFNAWCDRTPVLLFGGTGPMAVEKRRPGTDWIHTALVQGNIIRDYVKWDDQPASVESLSDSIYRAYRIAVTEPAGPVYVCFDAELQEDIISENMLSSTPELLHPPEITNFLPSHTPKPDPAMFQQISEAIFTAKLPVIVVDHTGRSDEAFYALSQLAEKWAIPVIDLGGRFNLPTNHPMNLTGAIEEVLAQADVVLALDVRDLYGTVSQIDRVKRTTTSMLQKNTRVFNIGLQDYIVRSWSSDFQRLYPTEQSILADTQLVLPAIMEALHQLHTSTVNQTSNSEMVIQIKQRYEEIQAWHDRLRSEWKETAQLERQNSPIATSVVADEVSKILENREFVVANGKLSGWIHRLFKMDQPRQYLGVSGGGGLGYGIGATIGACLAHRNTDKLVVNIQSDGDLLFTSGGLWTLAHHQLPTLIVMFNNRSYFNSEEHQINTARHRGRDVNKAVTGTRLENPSVNFAQLAESMGIKGIGPIDQVEDIGPALEEAIHFIEREKKAVLVDIVTQVK